MLETRSFGEVLQFKMSTVIGGVPVYWVAAYLVDGVLIDTGCAHTADEFFAEIAKHPVRMIVNTHFHEDHIGTNRRLSEERGLPIYAHPDSIPRLAMRPHLEPYQEIMWGYPEPSTASPLPPEVRAGRFRLRVIETPGHCAGHVVFFEPDQGWCFSGDIFARVNPKTIRPEESIPRTIASLRLLAALEVERLTLFTSIGKVVEDARGPLLQCVDYLDDLAARAKKLHQQGRGVDDIVREIFGAEHAFAEATGGHYTSAHLVRSALELP